MLGIAVGCVIQKLAVTGQGQARGRVSKAVTRSSPVMRDIPRCPSSRAGNQGGGQGSNGSMEMDWITFLVGLCMAEGARRASNSAALKDLRVAGPIAASVSRPRACASGPRVLRASAAWNCSP